MRIHRFTGPPVDTHAYLVGDPDSAEAWVVDAPLDTARRAFRRAEEEGWTITRLILTHAHFDHILDAPIYVAEGIPISLHVADLPMLRAPQTQMFGLPDPMPDFQPNHHPEEGDVLALGGAEWLVWHVPGHSPGHILLHCAARNVVLGGDMLFQGGYGRVDFPGCDAAAMRASLKRMCGLPKETRVYPGHGPDTTIGAERQWLKGLLDHPLA